jgi:hypothetical protein
MEPAPPSKHSSLASIVVMSLLVPFLAASLQTTWVVHEAGHSTQTHEALFYQVIFTPGDLDLWIQFGIEALLAFPFLLYTARKYPRFRWPVMLIWSAAWAYFGVMSIRRFG